MIFVKNTWTLFFILFYQHSFKRIALLILKRGIEILVSYRVYLKLYELINHNTELVKK
jgi:hypothetical protein